MSRIFVEFFCERSAAELGVPILLNLRTGRSLALDIYHPPKPWPVDLIANLGFSAFVFK